MDWQLADATPRRIMLNSGFIKSLRYHLNWNYGHDPPLSALHESLQNRSHTARIIGELRNGFYPNGIGLEGIRGLLEKHKILPLEERYVRAVESVTFEGEGEQHFILCMTSAMSKILVEAHRISIDTSFKRANGWEEFELETWHDGKMCSVTCARAFITSQSAKSHHFLFTKAFDIALKIPGEESSFITFMVLGLRRWLLMLIKGRGLSMVKELPGSCTYHPDSKDCCLQTMPAYAHLAHFYIQCTNHFEQKIIKLGNQISDTCRKAMVSLASSHPLPDFEGTLELIRQSGKKATDWLKDKEKGTPFMLPGLYQPISKIPLEIWCASPHTTNGNEQAHRSVNRTGIKVSPLAAVMHGMQYDFHAMYAVRDGLTIQTRDQLSAHFKRKETSFVRQVKTTKRKLQAIDTKLSALYEEIDEAECSIKALVGQLQLVQYRSPQYDAIAVKLQALQRDYKTLWENAEAVSQNSSGEEIREPRITPLFDQSLISHLPPLPFLLT
ncbi:hypothetical protein M422DRAFT_273917 [Sphaerobolus stellatus SS14]|uniref:MULE transposase domain-containing protein n=1 Tax=Sphaerobolus stellatus (strain SS14) TaxID=990650 RepID=A0A0C9UIB8_SPHS4|nr:hypothetical protein M422DRAFT_273917 [Sphaerobolus stellatus SS14]